MLPPDGSGRSPKRWNDCTIRSTARDELDRAQPEPRLGILRVGLQGGDQGRLSRGEPALHEVLLGQRRTIGRGAKRCRQAQGEDQSEDVDGSHGSYLERERTARTT